MIYVWGQININVVKVGSSCDPKKRVKSTDHWYPIIFKRIYKIINTNGITLKNIDNDIKNKFKNFNVESPHYSKNESSPTEFYKEEIIPKLDEYFDNLTLSGKIIFIKFNNLQEYENDQKNEISEEDKYILSNYDPDFEPNLDFSDEEVIDVRYRINNIFLK